MGRTYDHFAFRSLPPRTTPVRISKPSKRSGSSARQEGEGSYPAEAGGAAGTPPLIVVGPAPEVYQGRRPKGGALVKTTTSAATRGAGGAGGPAGRAVHHISHSRSRGGHWRRRGESVERPAQTTSECSSRRRRRRGRSVRHRYSSIRPFPMRFDF